MGTTFFLAQFLKLLSQKGISMRDFVSKVTGFGPRG